MDVFVFFTVAITRYTDRYHQDHAAKRPKLDTIKSSTHSTWAREESVLWARLKSHSGYI